MCRECGNGTYRGTCRGTSPERPEGIDPEEPRGTRKDSSRGMCRDVPFLPPSEGSKEGDTHRGTPPDDQEDCGDRQAPKAGGLVAAHRHIPTRSRHTRQKPPTDPANPNLSYGCEVALRRSALRGTPIDRSPKTRPRR